VGDAGADEERGEEADHADHRHLGQLSADDRRVELRPREEGEEDGARGGEEAQPLLLGTEAIEPAVVRGDRRHGDAHADLDEGDGDAQAVGNHGRDDRQGEPDGGDGEELLHDRVLLLYGPVGAASRYQEPSAPRGAVKGGLHPHGAMVPARADKANSTRAS